MSNRMRNAPQFDLSKVRTSTSSTSNTASVAPVVNELIAQAGSMKNGNTISLPVCGREVVFTLRTIPAGNVERKTLVWGENERLQELLTETALDDLIPSFVSGGQQNPAFGREVNGLVEVADGSRRRKAAILTGKDYRVLVGELDEEQMASLSQIGNDYRQTSAYERGRRYARLLDTKFDNNVSALAEAERISRKVIMRCLNTSELPVEIIKLFKNPTELSARAGEELHKVFETHGEAMMARVADLQEWRKAGEVIETDVILKTLKGAAGKPVKEEVRVRNFGPGVTARYKGDAVELLLKGVAPELIKRIEAVLEAAEKPGGNEAVEALFAQLEESVRKK